MVEVLFLTKHLGRIVGGSTMTHQHQVIMDLSGTCGSLIMATQIWAWWKVQEVLNLKLKKVEDVRSRNKKLVDPRLTETPQSGYKTHQIHPPRPIEPSTPKPPSPWPRSRGLPVPQIRFDSDQICLYSTKIKKKADYTTTQPIPLPQKPRKLAKRIHMC